MSKRTSLVAFIVAVVIQILILVAVPARKVFTKATGKTVVLKVQPVDPYSILSGTMPPSVLISAALALSRMPEECFRTSPTERGAMQ